MTRLEFLASFVAPFCRQRRGISAGIAALEPAAKTWSVDSAGFLSMRGVDSMLPAWRTREWKYTRVENISRRSGHSHTIMHLDGGK